MAPTTCSGFSAAIAARSFAPAVCGAEEEFMAGSLRRGAHLNYGAAGDFPVEVARESPGQRREVDRARDHAVEMPRRAVGRDAAPDFEPFLAACRGGVDAEQVHAAQDERQDRGREFRATGQPDARDVSPEVDL